MRSHFQSRAGFTLIEIVAVLILTAIVLVFAAMLLVTSTGVFISNKNAAEDSQKIQVAMNRLVKELTYAGAGTVMITDGQKIEWTSRHPDQFDVPVMAELDGTNLTLGEVALLDNVSAFTVSSAADPATTHTVDLITITLRSSRSAGVIHTTIVHPRYDL